jgi:very-short-patch-repair endonuclease
MLEYNPKLKLHTCRLRTEMTDAEQKLWSRLRGKQIAGVQFYRQKLLGNYIVDFYAPAAKLVVEVDGSQHTDEKHVQKDTGRDAWLRAQGLTVLRFDNLQVLQETEAALQ